MRSILSARLRQAADDIHETDSLTEEDVIKLNSKAPTILSIVQKNIGKDGHAFKGLSSEEKRILLAFVVYKRQNITTGPTERPNDEDAARILHGRVYSLEGNEAKDAKVMKELEEELKKQLSKAGVNIK